MIPPSGNKIIIAPIGEYEESLLDQISFAVEKKFHCHTEIMILLKDLEFAFHPARNQYHSTAILERLCNGIPPSALKLLAVCQEDLFIPILTHVYGEAQLNGEACIVSTHRLKESVLPVTNPTSYAGRVVKEAVHELGHTFGLRHCPDHSCIMHYCRTLSDVDKKSDDFCRYCSILLDDAFSSLDIANR